MMSRFIYITIVLHMFSFSQEKSTIKKADNFIYEGNTEFDNSNNCLLYTSPSPRD